MTAQPDVERIDEIFAYLRQVRGFDFSAYKRASLTRRLVKRMQMVDVHSFGGYLEYLQGHPDEFAALFNTILINVTSFFRDHDMWTQLDAELLPRLLASREPNAPIRVWSAGCASGQEAYTAAMLLAEHLGVEALRERVKIYATDLDEDALREGRSAIYSERQVADVPPALLDKYFERHGTQYTINRDIRRAVIFGRHDILEDAPISAVDLLFCRNTLMYLNAQAQSRVLARFYFSVKVSGYLVLGRAEMLFSHVNLFVPQDLRRRIFRAVPQPDRRNRLQIVAHGQRETMSNPVHHEHAQLREAAFESDAVAHLVLDRSASLVATNALARRLFGVAARDIGRPLRDLDVSYRPADLRGAIDRVVAERREMRVKDVAWAADGVSRVYDVVISPLLDDERALLGTRVSFVDVTRSKTLQDELHHSKQELETAYEELQSTNEELETTNEELQSTVEELETTNEELQSTNEELETMNEELQSTNEELQTMNDEMRTRSTELNAAHSFLESVFTSLRSAVVVVDRAYRVRVWNNRAEDLWGLRPDEAQDAHILNLDIGLPVGELRQPIRDILSGAGEHIELTVPATNRKGRSIECQLSLSPLRERDRAVTGVIVLMDAIQVQR
jgi:two-component system CheB/CheR fusion protein